MPFAQIPDPLSLSVGGEGANAASPPAATRLGRPRPRAMAALQGYLVALQGLGGGRAGGGGEGWKWVREVGRKLGGERKTER